MGIQSLIVSRQDHVNLSPWLVLSKLPVNLPEERPLVSNWPPRLPVRAPPPPVESRSPIVIVPVPWLFVRSVVTKNPLSSSSVNCPSSVSGEKLLRISKLISGSRALPLALCKRPARLTWSACSIHQLVRHPRQACDHHAKGYSARQKNPWRTSLNPVSTVHCIPRSRSTRTTTVSLHKTSIFFRPLLHLKNLQLGLSD